MTTVYLYVLDWYVARKWEEFVDAEGWEQTKSGTRYWQQLKIDLTKNGKAYLEVFEGDDYSKFFERLLEEGWLASTESPTGIRYYSKLIFEKHNVIPSYG